MGKKNGIERKFARSLCGNLDGSRLEWPEKAGIVRANITFSDYQQSYNPLEYLIVIFLASTSKTTHKVPRTDEKSLIILPPDTTSLSAALTQSHRMLWPLMALWDDIYTKLKQGGIPLSDTSNQGAGGILNEHIQDDRSTPIPGISF
ncbi:uncharacterized protein BO87DRAFT_385563 [Aspergillus neoniger CBS 115656]|uniref:Uncharacterized protein n=1 Tax=Aspergillus neoniger (strain CBS 115656) TaxID=1448310 RepID=A0A318YRA2_ASPNB|nr:hypothetical protein BO87DRAFT_385563 [Aspergillus neoniger CBS 115656]PYH35283.1 hypothetical protein BO87DRAFT_385563 [Aspergillus neoniger CBS 115656]